MWASVVGFLRRFDFFCAMVLALRWFLSFLLQNHARDRSMRAMVG